MRDVCEEEEKIMYFFLFETAFQKHRTLKLYSFLLISLIM